VEGKGDTPASTDLRGAKPSSPGLSHLIGPGYVDIPAFLSLNRKDFEQQALKAALLQVWEACGQIHSKRPSPFLPEVVAVLKQEGELTIRPETERLPVCLSPATIDRLLKTHRPKPLRGRSTTKPGTLLKHQIPVRTFADWDEARPGLLKVDLVAHCGQSTKGEYLHTLTAVGIDTRWCELGVLPNRGQQAMKEAVERIRNELPFPLLGIDSDNDSAFSNGNLVRYCKAQKISFARRSSPTSRSSSFIRARSSLVRPPRRPVSISVRRTHFLSASGEQPILPAIDAIAAH